MSRNLSRQSIIQCRGELSPSLFAYLLLLYLYCNVKSLKLAATNVSPLKTTEKPPTRRTAELNCNAGINRIWCGQWSSLQNIQPLAGFNCAPAEHSHCGYQPSLMQYVKVVTVITFFLCSQSV